MTRMFNSPHPGEILGDALEALGLSSRQFAAHIGVSPATVTRIVRGETAISPVMALKLAKAITGPDAAMWLRMQVGYDLWQAEHSTDLSRISRYPVPVGEFSGCSDQSTRLCA